MASEKGATCLDKLCHKFYDYPKGHGEKTDYVCRLCGGSLETYYCEERLYLVQCAGCGTFALVKTANPEDAARVTLARPTLIPPNEPLTLEQLRGVDGMPGYWADDESWGIISVDSNGRFAGVPFFRGRKNEVNFEYDIESRGMNIYPYPPALIDREKWEPCEWCGSFGKTSDNWVCTLEDDDGHTVTNNHIVVCATANYCPSCGRPLTPEVWEEMERRING